MNQHLERLDGLAPVIRMPVLRLLELTKQKLGATLMIVWGFRSVADQMRIYQQGRVFDRAQGIWVVDDLKQVVTKAQPGSSAHNVVTPDGKPAALGVDVIPLDATTGQPNWAPDDLFWDDLYELSWKVGLDPLGDPIGAYLQADKGHFEEPSWKLKLDGLGLVLPSPVLTQV